MKNLLVLVVSVLAIPTLSLETKVTVVTAPGARLEASQMASNRLVIPVLVIHYFPTSGTNLDLLVTGDVGGSLGAIREKTHRQTCEAIEDHMHQIEAVLNQIDGLDQAPPSEWPGLLCWGRFVGSDQSHRDWWVFIGDYDSAKEKGMGLILK